MGGINHTRAFRLAFTGNLALDPYSPFVPHHLRAAVKQRERHFDAERTRKLFRSEVQPIADAWSALREQCNGRTDRRQAEATIADYIEQQVLPLVTDDDDDRDRLRWLPRDLRECRKSGVWGRCKHTGDTIIAWDAKCGDLHLCPDEAREEQKRLAEKYLPALTSLDAAGYKIQKLVISPPNVSVNDYQLDAFNCVTLAGAMQYLFRRFRDVAFRSIKNGERQFPIAGALGVLEAPLSAHGDWNVHLNVFVAIEPGKFFDWSAFREALGGWQLDIKTKQDMIEATTRRRLAAGDNLATLNDQDVFMQALLECIKYPVQTVAAKSGKHDGEWVDGVFVSTETNTPVAPPMTRWPPERFLEWYRAQKGFRRTRGYGKDVLFGIKAPVRDKIDLDQVEFFGQVRFVGKGYVVEMPLVDLIPGDNSPKGDAPADAQVGNRGPPGDRRPFVERVADEILDHDLTELGI